ncbi:flagellar filament capping protein FliD [Aquisalimonas asiatica]|uniref:Flagellar hook-associated protein 2 n=1 Tax=Aquisalimonas asiatica TaxID=406100 RepID=A0A1H8QTP6_9GAMM|nr:flagellar filament capping protein FliD [Aquisalimonas asiatica]SEO57456.1 flagellar hook-associated protein 2 [Aquisalimonas asiatica]
MSSVSSLGVGSGLDIRQIVDDLVAAERAPAENRIDRQEERLETEISAFGKVQSLMGDFQSTVAELQDPDSFVSRDTSSSSEAVGISAGDNAEDGSWEVDVQQLARAQRSVLSVDNIEERDEPLGTGEITISSGDRVSTITIDEDNQTLEGIRDAINGSTAGVSASIINDGNGQRLVLNGQDEGADSAFTMDVEGDLAAVLDPDGDGALDELQAAQDAEFTVDGLTMTRSSNEVDDVLDDITLDLESVTDSPATVSVTTDSAGIQSQVESFVEAFNTFQGGIAELTDYDRETEEAGPLNGESSVTGIVSQLRSAITEPVEALEGRAVRSMADIGILTTRSGSLELDASRLDDAVREDPEAVTALFAETGIVDGEGFEFDGAGSASEAGRYPVNVTEPATRGEVAFSGDGFDLSGGDNDIRVEIDGVRSGLLSLPAEEFDSGSDLARALQAAINGDDQLNDAGVGVTVGFDEDTGEFTMASEAFGSASTVEIAEAGATLQEQLGLAVGMTGEGQDVAGTIGGIEAEGSGRTLTGSMGVADGLSVQVDEGEVGDLGVLTFSTGLMSDLDNRINALIGPEGSLTSRESSLNNRLSDLEDDRARLDQRMSRVEDRYIQQFTAMDRMVAELQQTSEFLSQQLPGGGMSGVSL